MSMMMNIATQDSQAALNAAGSFGLSNVTSTSKTSSSEFGLLIAKLLGLSAPNHNEQIANKDPSNDLLAVGQTKPIQDKTTISAIADLMKAAESIEASLNSGAPIDQATIEAAMASINTLLAKLETIAPSQTGATASMLIAQMQGQGPNANSLTNALNANPLANGQNANPEIAKNILSQTQPIQEIFKGLTAKETISGLNQMAQKLAQLTNGATEVLGSKFEQLAQKLAHIAPANATTKNSALKSANSLAMNMNADSAINNEAAKSINALLGNKNIANADNVKTSEAKLDHSAIAYIKGQKTAPISTNNITAQELGNSAKIITTGVSAPTAMAAASLTSATPLANNMNIAGQTADPILIAHGLVQPASGSNIAALKPATALYQGPQQNLNLPHIAYEFARNVQNGLSRFQIRLDPPEMGRIDVKMEIDKTGALSARLSVERADTLDLLQRDARALERALAQAGLDSNKANLEFSLKDNPFERGDNFFSQGEENFLEDLGDESGQTSADIIAQIPSTIIYHGTASMGGLNITA